MRGGGAALVARPRSAVHVRAVTCTAGRVAVGPRRHAGWRAAEASGCTALPLRHGCRTGRVAELAGHAAAAAQLRGRHGAVGCLCAVWRCPAPCRVGCGAAPHAPASGEGGSARPAAPGAVVGTVGGAVGAAATRLLRAVGRCLLPVLSSASALGEATAILPATRCGRLLCRVPATVLGTAVCRLLRLLRPLCSCVCRASPHGGLGGGPITCGSLRGCVCRGSCCLAGIARSTARRRLRLALHACAVRLLLPLSTCCTILALHRTVPCGRGRRLLRLVPILACTLHSRLLTICGGGSRLGLCGGPLRRCVLLPIARHLLLAVPSGGRRDRLLTAIARRGSASGPVPRCSTSRGPVTAGSAGTGRGRAVPGGRSRRAVRGGSCRGPVTRCGSRAIPLCLLRGTVPGGAGRLLRPTRLIPGIVLRACGPLGGAGLLRSTCSIPRGRLLPPVATRGGRTHSGRLQAR